MENQSVKKMLNKIVFPGMLDCFKITFLNLHCYNSQLRQLLAVFILKFGLWLSPKWNLYKRCSIIHFQIHLRMKNNADEIVWKMISFHSPWETNLHNSTWKVVIIKTHGHVISPTKRSDQVARLVDSTYKP